MLSRSNQRRIGEREDKRHWDDTTREISLGIVTSRGTDPIGNEMLTGRCGRWIVRGMIGRMKTGGTTGIEGRMSVIGDSSIMDVHLDGTRTI